MRNEYRQFVERSVPQNGIRSGITAVALMLASLLPVNARGQAALAAGGATTPATKFLLGADITAVDAPGRGGRGARTYQENGKPSDEFTILHNHGWTAFRVRVFMAPVRSAPNNTLEAAIPLAKQIKSAGATLLLSMHFSDTWSDPKHQEIPTAWRGLDIDGLEKQWEIYAHDTIKTLKDAGAMPDWVQIGNEITRGTQWPIAQLQIPGSTEYPPPQPYDENKQWDNLTRLLKAGIRGVKSGAGDTPPRIAIHIDKGGNWEVTKWFFDHVNAAHVDYDIISQSFYPPWGHGTLEDLCTNMTQCAQRYDKDFLVVETGYTRPNTQDTRYMLWPVTPEGRLQYMVDLVNTVKNAPRGLGVMYWAPERDAWNADGTPGPTVFTLDHLKSLTTRPASHAPTTVNP
jgi:arabinogalactan endo-1,4-beta-galactosidase